MFAQYKSIIDKEHHKVYVLTINVTETEPIISLRLCLIVVGGFKEKSSLCKLGM